MIKEGGQVSYLPVLILIWQIDNQLIPLGRMSENEADRKYSKISPALKCYFLHSLYFKCMTIKDAAARCKLNYSTAKVIIRDLTHRERRFVKKIVRERDTLRRGDAEGPRISGYRELPEREEVCKEQGDSDHTSTSKDLKPVEIISRVAFDFFAREEILE